MIAFICLVHNYTDTMLIFMVKLNYFTTQSMRTQTSVATHYLRTPDLYYNIHICQVKSSV